MAFESEAARQRARQRLLGAAKKHGIVPLGFIDAQLRTDRSHATAGRVVLELADIRTPDALEDQLRRALEDPTLTVLTWSPERESWLDGTNQVVELPRESEGRAVSVLESRGEPATALIHHPGALADPELSEAVLAAVRFVVERHRLETDPSAPRIDRSRLPSGFVTLLFTDIEGSTELLTQLTDRYAGVLGRVRKTVRQEVRRHNGHQIDVTGDETFSVFTSATAALEATVEIQRRLEAGRWPGGLPVRVRSGLHSGEVTVSEDGYIGLTVHEAARVMTAGHGGQILLTSATQEAWGEAGSVRSLGEYRLKGLPQPVELLQVLADGLREEFPPLRVPAAS